MSTDMVDELDAYSSNPDRKEEMKLLEPMTYISKIPMLERTRKIAEAFNYWLQIPHKKLEQIVQLLRLTDASNFLYDDIQDSPHVRRGVPSAHIVYGIGQTTGAMTYASIIVMEKIASLGHPDAVNVFIEQVLICLRGAGMDVHWRTHCICPTEEEYKLMAERKTGGHFNAVVLLMQLFSNCKKNFVRLVNILGLYFQVRDDYFNLCDQNYHNEEGYYEDLAEGKFSFPIVHAIRSHPDDKALINILKERPTDVQTQQHCVTLLEKFGSLRYTRRVLDDLDQQMRKEIERLGGNPMMEKVLDEWRKMVIDCDKSKEVSTAPNT